MKLIREGRFGHPQSDKAREAAKLNWWILRLRGATRVINEFQFFTPRERHNMQTWFNLAEERLKKGRF